MKKTYENDHFFYGKLNYKDTDGELFCVQHYHNFYELYFLEKDNCNYFIVNKSYHLLPGDIALIPPHIVHSTLYTQNNASRILINCSGNYIPSAAISLFSKNNYLYRNPQIKDHMLMLLDKIEKEYAKPDQFSMDAIKSLLQMLFIEILRNSNQYQNSESKSGYIEHSVNYIQKNFTCDISLSETAKLFGVSTEHFSRKFKQEIGLGFNEYITILRLKKAEELLKTETISISNVASLCGFNDSNYFSIRFKRMYGISPKAFQLKVRN